MPRLSLKPRVAHAVRRGRNRRRTYPNAVGVMAPNESTLGFLRTTDARVIAEIGVYRGHTSMEIARWLDGDGELHLYDFDATVHRVTADLAAAGYRNVRAFSNSDRYLDSYNWPLARMLQEHREPIYDYVMLDGAHTWAIDALAVLLVDRLLKPGGYLDLDDYEWTLAGSEALRPESFALTAKLYTREQIDAQQVRMICDLLIRRDSRYLEVVPNRIWRKR